MKIFALVLFVLLAGVGCERTKLEEQLGQLSPTAQVLFDRLDAIESRQKEIVELVGAVEWVKNSCGERKIHLNCEEYFCDDGVKFCQKLAKELGIDL